jgi:glycine/D-amino acid oxidase-like deaminating enzyme/nitrite reductase/ring-hydroxylating ferredoxin subunit
MDTRPYWQESTSLPEFAPLSADLEVDVVVVGAGLTGITAAYLLKESGAKVALLERRCCAGADTGHTTAHLTYVTDYRLHDLVKTFGKDGAKAFWEAGVTAIDQIKAIVSEKKIDCEFKSVPGFLHGSIARRRTNKERRLLEEDDKLARELGFRSEFVEETPYADRPGVKFADQAKFHPLKYLAALLQGINGDGSYVFENSEVSEFQAKPLAVKANGHSVRSNYLVIATHTPVMGNTSMRKATLFQSKLALYTSYVLGAVLPKGLVPEALYWDTTDPYYYLRIDPREENDYAIFGGEDVKTGQEKDPVDVFRGLEAKLKEMLPQAEVKNRWLGQVVETNDGLPFIGENHGQQFIATGFCGNGFTLGTLAAVMARDRYLGKTNPWFDLFRVDRRKFHGGTWRYIKENLDYPYYMLRDRVAGADSESVDDLKIGEGKIVKLNGEKVAAFRDETGKVILSSPVCTHMKCIVHWNDADKTWDCPCHGSRFKSDGEVFSGPAETALERKQWPE